MNLETNDSSRYVGTDFSKIRVGIKTLEDAVYNVNTFSKINKNFGDKQFVLKAIHDGNLKAIREVSNFYYKVSGIYQRLCRYMAYMYRYDWVVTPFTQLEKNIKVNKVLENFYKALNFLDNFQVKKFFGDVALKVIRYGCYYGYLIEQPDTVLIQELPAEYCRSRFTGASGWPVVEFNMKFFDVFFTNKEQREKILSMWPKEFEKGYRLYKQNKLPPDFPGDESGWYLLDIEKAIKFNFNGEDFPMFISTIPALIDLDHAQGVDRKKIEQQLLKIIIQKMPTDKNGDLIFDIDEAQQMHNNAVKMLGRAIGIDVLTTFADVEVADMAGSASANSASNDSMERQKQSVYDQSGVSYMQFNADNSIALDRSISNDEASIYNLIQQFESFLNLLLKKFNKGKKTILKAQILPTTIYNYKELSKLYKEQTQLGYSKMLPQIALGQSESTILASAYFENDILDLVHVFIPPLMSSTMNAEALNATSGKGDNAGRPTNEELGKPTTEKTAQNKESMGAG